MSRNNRIIETQPESNRVNIRGDTEYESAWIRNPSVRDYFQNEDNVKYEGCIDNIKLSGNIRILSLNPHGCKPNDISKMNELKNAIEKYNIDIIMMNETNTKWNTININHWLR